MPSKYNLIGSVFAFQRPFFLYLLKVITKKCVSAFCAFSQSSKCLHHLVVLDVLFYYTSTALYFIMSCINVFLRLQDHKAVIKLTFRTVVEN